MDLMVISIHGVVKAVMARFMLILLLESAPKILLIGHQAVKRLGRHSVTHGRKTPLYVKDSLRVIHAQPLHVKFHLGQSRVVVVGAGVLVKDLMVRRVALVLVLVAIKDVKQDRKEYVLIVRVQDASVYQLVVILLPHLLGALDSPEVLEVPEGQGNHGHNQ